MHHSITARILAIAFLLSSLSLPAQVINWEQQAGNRGHMVHAGLGAEYGITYSLGYAYTFPIASFPVVAGAEYSFPSGKRWPDDFKTKFGVQIRLLRLRHFQFSTGVQGIFRRYENDQVRLANWGMETRAVLGYYRSRWFAAAELGFDKAIMTHFRHSDKYRTEYPDVQDGWYLPPTGGNFYYGLQAGLSFRRQDITLRAGTLVAEGFNTKPMLPYYVLLGYNWRIGGR